MHTSAVGEPHGDDIDGAAMTTDTLGLWNNLMDQVESARSQDT
jgi:hypothetical protein